MATVQTFDYSVDLLAALLWQYNDAERLQSILANKQAWYEENQKGYWEDWFRDVFNLETANDFGLQVWAIILNIPLVVEVAPSDTGILSFAFGGFRSNFGRSNFARQYTGAQSLNSEQARTVLRLRYFQITTRGAVTEINAFLKHLFGAEGSVFAVDGLDMTCDYVFTFAIPSQLQFVLERYDILPRPAGVGVNYIVTTVETWGFDDYHENFDNGNFSEI